MTGGAVLTDADIRRFRTEARHQVMPDTISVQRPVDGPDGYGGRGVSYLPSWTVRGRLVLSGEVQASVGGAEVTRGTIIVVGGSDVRKDDRLTLRGQSWRGTPALRAQARGGAP